MLTTVKRAHQHIIWLFIARLRRRERTRCIQGWAQGSFVEAEVKAAMSLTEARQGRELEAEARQTKFEARPRRGDP